MKMIRGLTFLIILKVISADNINCWYHDGNSSIYFEGKTGYACELSTERIDKYDEYGTVIELVGTHKIGKIDDDVKLLGSRIEIKFWHFPSIFCEKFKNLEIVKLTNTIVADFEVNAFKNCANLKLLQFFNNKLLRLPESLLISSRKLTQFSITRNSIRTLPEIFFLSQSQLEKLDLDSNKITNLPNHIFRSLTNLKTLDLQHNRIRKLNSLWFKNLIKLDALILSGNEITDLPKNIFEPCQALGKLWIDNNKITIIHSDSFNSQSAFRYLNFQSNKINAIDDKFIDNIDITKLWTDNDICGENEIMLNENEDEARFAKCYENYQPRIEQGEENVFKPMQLNLIPTLEDHENCGRVSILDGNIIGGRQIIQGAFPWNAAVVRRNGNFLCGGTLVTDQMVVSAAHCFFNKLTPINQVYPNDISVLLGVHDLKLKFENGRTSNSIRQIHLHPDWNPQNEDYDADIAVLILEQKVQFTNVIQPICLGDVDSFVTTPLSGIVIGYGQSEDTTKLHENIPKILNIPIHNDTTCFLKNYILARFSSARTFCGGQGDGTGVCKGDSGSGVYVMINNVFYLRGIVSASLFNLNSTCDVNSYSIFTNTPVFYDWLTGIADL